MDVMNYIFSKFKLPNIFLKTKKKMKNNFKIYISLKQL